MAKKNGKSQSSPNVTLHNFFTPKSGSPPANKLPKIHKAKSKTKFQPSPEEIIIIDSDDEPEDTYLRPARSKRRLSECSMIDLLGSSPIPSTSKRIHTTRHPSEHENHIISSPVKEECTFFGKPSLLLQTPALSRRTPEPPPFVPSLSVASSLFGEPTLLLPFSKTNTTTFAPSAHRHTSILATVDVDIDVDFPDTVWDTGDDEVEFEEGNTSENEDMVVCDMPPEPTSSITEGSTSCPSCGKSFHGSMKAGLEEHVNGCLDSQQLFHTLTRNLATSNDPSKSLRPVSSFQPPATPPPKQQIGPGNAFSVLMSSHKENEAWKEASSAEDRGFRPNKSNGGRRKAPFYKVLQGMAIAVDAFRYGAIPDVTAYFLTHAHSDHYTNLSSSWDIGPIYCSQGTANLIIHMLKVDPKWVHPLPMDVPTVVPNTNGVRVTLIEANHCPGSCLFFFEGQQTVNAGDSTFKSAFVGSPRTFRYLHCGDFRASPQHVLHPAVKGKKIDHVYLDTTYLDPKYTFAPQPLVISACAELARRLVSGESLQDNNASMGSWLASATTSIGDATKGKQKAQPDRHLFVIGTYSIGKERIVKAVAKALKSKVYCDSRKSAILRCEDDDELHSMLTSNPLDASVHLVPLGMVSSDKLKPYVERFKGHFNKAVGFRPTGWTYTQPSGTDQSPSVQTIITRAQKNGFTHLDLRPARNSTSQLQMYPVPYSEHSSFFELTCFAMSFNWGRMIATVNVGSEASRGKMSKWVQRWETERKKRSSDFIVPHRHVEYW